MANLSELLEMFRKLKNPLTLTDEEIKEVLVYFMDSTNSYFDKRTVQEKLSPEMYAELIKAIGVPKKTVNLDTKLGILKQKSSDYIIRDGVESYEYQGDCNKYVVYRVEDKANRKDGDKVEPSPSNILMITLAEDTPLELLLAMASSAAEKKINMLENENTKFYQQLVQLGRYGIVVSLSEAVQKVWESMRLKENLIDRLNRLGEHSSEENIATFFEVASTLETEFIAPEVKRMFPKAKVEDGETYTITNRKLVSSSGKSRVNLEIDFLEETPDTYVDVISKALNNQAPNDSISLNARLSIGDKERLLNHALRRVEQYKTGITNENDRRLLSSLNKDIRQLLNKPAEIVSQVLLDTLSLTQTALSMKDVEALLPQEKRQMFVTSVSRDLGEPDSNIKFVITRNEDNGYSIRRQSQAIDTQEFVSFGIKELDSEKLKEVSKRTMEDHLFDGETKYDIFMGTEIKSLLRRATSMLDTYLKRDENRNVIIRELENLESMSPEEAKELLFGIMVMAQPVLIPDENRPKPFDELFKSDKKYRVNRMDDGQFYLQTIPYETIDDLDDLEFFTERVKFDVAGLELNRNLPLLISAMRNQRDGKRIPATGYLTSAGIKTILDVAIPGFEKYQETHKVKNGELSKSVADMSQDLEVVAAMQGAKGVVAELATHPDKELLHGDE